MTNTCVATRKDALESLLDGVKHLPPTPALLIKLIELFRDSDHDVDAIVGLMRQEPALTAEVLRRCNSSFFGGENPVTDVRQAVFRVGFFEIYRLSVALFGMQSMTKAKAANCIPVEELWKHAATTAIVAGTLARDLGESEGIAFTAGLLHDVGKIGIRDSVLSKPGKLDDEEFAVMKSHPGVGEGILRPVGQLADVIPGVVSHHERFDGKGYPKGLKGEEIPLMGRIIGVADAFDAMTSDRVYRPRLSDEVAVGELKKHSGTQFDSRVVKAFLSVMDKGLVVTEPSKFPQGGQ